MVYNSDPMCTPWRFLRLPAHRFHKRLDKIDGCLKTECFLYVCVDIFWSVLTKLYKYIVWVAIQMISRRAWLDHVNITRKTLLSERIAKSSVTRLQWNISYKIANINSSVGAGVIYSQYGQEHIMYGNVPIPSRAYDFANFHVSDRSWLHFIYEKQVCQSVVRGLSTPTLLSDSLLLSSWLWWSDVFVVHSHATACTVLNNDFIVHVSKTNYHLIKQRACYTWIVYRMGLAVRWHPVVYTMVQSQTEINSTIIP